MAAQRFAEQAAPRMINNENGTYELGNKLGQGGFGVVYMALNTLTGQSVAVKSVLAKNLTDEARVSIQTEINLLRALDHPNIVKYIDTISQGTDLYIILEFMESGSIGAMRKKFKFQEPLIAHWIEQVLRGLQYLHSQGVLHRDIKGANILTNKHGEVKLADFGVAIKSSALTGETGEDDIDVVGTPYWMAPEIIQMSKPTEACDIWSVGCTIIELITGKPPYYDLQPMQALFRIVSDDYPPFPESVTKALHDFLIACFQKDPNMRPRASDLLRPGKYRWLQQKTKMNDESRSSTTFADTVAESNPSDGDHEVLEQTVRIARLMNSSGASSVRNDTPSPAWSDDAEFYTAKAPEIQHLAEGALQEAESMDSKEVTVKVRKPKGSELTPRPRSAASSKGDTSRESKSSVADFDDREATVKINKSKGSLLAAQAQVRGAGGPSGKAPAAESDEEDWDAELGDSEPPEEDQTIRFGAKLKLPAAALRAAASGANGGGEGDGGRPTEGFSHARMSSFGAGLLGKLKTFRDDEEEEDDFGDEDFDLGEDGELKLWNAAQEEAKSDSMTLSARGTIVTAEEHDGNDEDDPFAEFDDEDELDTNALQERDQQGERLRECMQLMGELTPAAADDEVRSMCLTLTELFTQNPTLRENLITEYGVVPIMEMLTVQSVNVLPSIVKVINVIIEGNERIQEHVSLMGLLPVMIRFAKSDSSSNTPHKRLLSSRSARKPRTITPLQVEATRFVRKICIDDVIGKSRKTVLQMFIGCGGLELLVHLLSLACTGDLRRERERRECICTSVDGITRVFTLQTLRKNDFCRLLAKYGMITYLFDAIERFSDAEEEEYLIKVVKVLEDVSNYSRADMLLKDQLTQRNVLWRVVDALRATESKSSEALQLLLKSVKHICMSFGGSQQLMKKYSLVPQSTPPAPSEDALAILEDAGVIEFLVNLLGASASYGTAKYGKEIEYQAVPILFYLCLVNKKRQEKAALAGLVPHLRRYIEARSHLQQFATQILCDLAHTSNTTRKILQRQGIIELYMKLLGNQNWDHSALDAIAVCFAADPASLERQVVEQVGSIIGLFNQARSRKVQMILENLVQMTEASVALSCALGDDDQFMSELVVRLRHANAFQRTNLLKLLKAIYRNRSNPSALIGEYDLYDLVQGLATENDQIVVKQLASELLTEFNRRTSTYLLQPPENLDDLQANPPVPPGQRRRFTPREDRSSRSRSREVASGRERRQPGIMRRFKRIIS